MRQEAVAARLADAIDEAAPSAAAARAVVDLSRFRNVPAAISRSAAAAAWDRVINQQSGGVPRRPGPASGSPASPSRPAISLRGDEPGAEQRTMAQRPRLIALQQRMLTEAETAEYLGRDLSWFRPNLDRLEETGFPAPLNAVDRYDRAAIDKWLDARARTGWCSPVSV